MIKETILYVQRVKKVAAPIVQEPIW